MICLAAMFLTRSQARKSLRESCTMTGASVRATKAARASAAHPSGRSPISTLAPSGDHTSGDDDATSLSVRSATASVRPVPAS